MLRMVTCVRLTLELELGLAYRTMPKTYMNPKHVLIQTLTLTLTLALALALALAIARTRTRTIIPT
jgi:hypothetical protein